MVEIGMKELRCGLKNIEAMTGGRWDRGVCGAKADDICPKHKTHTANLCPHFIKTGMSLLRSEDTMEAVWHGLKKESSGSKAKKAILECLKREGGAASLDDCCKACGMSKEECKSLISSMKNVKMSPHGDVILMDGL